MQAPVSFPKIRASAHYLTLVLFILFCITGKRLLATDIQSKKYPSFLSDGQIQTLAKKIPVNAVSVELVEQSESCVILKTIDENGNILFWIISEIANFLLPKAVDYLCLRIVGRDNAYICDAVVDGITLLTSMISVGKSVTKSVRALSYFAERQSVKSALKFSTATFEVAQNIKATLEAYDKLNLINWDQISTNEEFDRHIINYNAKIGSVYIGNATQKTVTLNFSADGTTTDTTVTIVPRQRVEIDFYRYGFLKQEYGFCTSGVLCNYQLFTGKGYLIRKNIALSQFYLEEE
jgi:hypothetical protein